MEEKDSADVISVARTIYNEARSDGEAGMKAVAEVIFNRIGHPAYGSKASAAAVVSAKGQFLGYSSSEPPAEELKNPKDAAAWKYSRELARKVCKKETPGSTTDGAHAFHQSKASTGLVDSTWTATHTKQIGKHHFFKIEKKVVPKK